jgi:4-oxalocrotonate tautomerase
MPFVNIKVSGAALTSTQIRELQTRASALMQQVMRKQHALTVVAVEQAAAENWSIGAAHVPAAAFLEVKVTHGTNSAEEKERFVAQAMQMLREVIGTDLHPTTYVVVHEVPSDAWGYGGYTQANRAKVT